MSLYTYGWNIPARFGRLGDLEEEKISECLYLYGSNNTCQIGRFRGIGGGDKEGRNILPPYSRNYGRAMSCFTPRHAVRVTREGVATDFLICFECRQVVVERDGKEISDFVISPSPKAVFDDVLRKAGMPLASNEPKRTP